MVLMDAASAFSRKSRLPLSSTIQIVTSTFCFLASASAAATMVLIAARFKYFRVGRSADDGAATEDAVATRLSITTSSLNMRRMLPQDSFRSLVCSFQKIRREGRPGPVLEIRNKRPETVL